MNQFFLSGHNLDENGNPAGGYSLARGVSIEWQNGPLGRGEHRQEPNGAFVETVISMVMDRIQFYEQTRFACEENKLALSGLKAALHALESRTQSRESRGVEGTHTV